MQKSIVLFIAAVVASAALIIGFHTNIYVYPAVGAVWELLWLPCWLALIVIPIILFFHWKKFPNQNRLFNAATLVVLLAMYCYVTYTALRY